jgi:hypothetical protein
MMLTSDEALAGDPCVVAGCRWGSTGLAGGGLPTCIPAGRSTPASARPPGCLFAWIADEDTDADLDTPYAVWAKGEIDRAAQEVRGGAVGS